MVHDGRRLVADRPAGADDPPDEVDVLAVAHRRVETDQLAADQQHRRRHVRDPRAGPDAGRTRPEVQRRAGALVARQQPGPGTRRHRRRDPRRDRPHGGVREVSEQHAEPVGVRREHIRRKHVLREHVRVAEQDQRSHRGRRARQPGGRRTERAFVAQHPRAGGGRGRGGAVGRAVVDDDHLGAAAGECRDQPSKPLGVVTDRQDGRHAGGAPRRRRRRGRMRQAGLDEPAGERARARPGLPHRLAGQQRFPNTATSGGQRQQTQW